MDVILDIQLDRNVYFTGQNINGTLNLKNKNIIGLEKIELFFAGKIANIISCNNVINIFNNNITFYYDNINRKFVTDKNYGNNLLNSNTYVFNFIMNIPTGNLPPSFEHEKFKVIYFINYEIYYYSIKKKRRLHVKDTRSINILPNINVFDKKYLPSPKSSILRKNIYNYNFINTGFIDYEIKMDYSLYTYNDYIPLRFRFVNQSEISVKNIFIKLELKRLLLNTYDKNKVYENKIITSKKELFNSENTTNIYNREYHIFMISPIFDESCVTIFPEMTNKLFEVKYKLHIYCKMETHCRKVIKFKDNSFDIIIGTLRNNDLIEVPSYS